MIEVLFLATALSMDAFAVSIGLGSKGAVDERFSLSLKAGLWFGLFQGIMPLIGYLAGYQALSWVENYANWIAFALLAFIGGKMIYESFQEGIEEDICKMTNRVMLTLAIATSIDAMAAGFTLNLLSVNAYLSCLIIAATTFCFSWVGIHVGYKSGTWLESKAELFGGVVLVLIGLKMLVF